jgi:hypothetical protein
MHAYLVLITMHQARYRQKNALSGYTWSVIAIPRNGKVVYRVEDNDNSTP